MLKSCDNIVKNSLKHGLVFMNNTDSKVLFTREEISQITNIPEPVSLVYDIISLLSEKDVNVNEVIDMVSRDQSLVARILKLINSSFYNLRNTIDSVEKAILLLGITNIKMFIFSAICFDFYGKDEQEEWEHSYTTSRLLLRLARDIKTPISGKIQLAGLLHDIGKVIFRRKYTEKYRFIANESKAKHVSVCEYEKQVFGNNHAEIGSWLLESWKLPEDIIIPTVYHHSEKLPANYALETSVLKLANCLDNSARGMNYSLPDFEISKTAGLLDIDIEEILTSHKEFIISGINTVSLYSEKTF